MSKGWMGLKIDPRPSLSRLGDSALEYWVKRDLLELKSADVRELWKLPAVKTILQMRNSEGGWDYPKKEYGGKSWGSDYRLLETFRQLRLLVELYGLDRRHPALNDVAAFIAGFQSARGDIRGIIGNQYMPYYQGAITELLIKAGYAQDACVSASLEWLLSMRQDDGGWIVPMQAVPTSRRSDELWSGDPIEPDRSKPSSHMATGMVLRAFAAEPQTVNPNEVMSAAELLASRFFTADKYHDRRHKDYWLKFQFPFWWTDLVSALDSITRLRVSWEDPAIESGLSWFLDNQDEDGLWETGYGKGRRAASNRAWVGLAICRILKRVESGELGS